MLPLGKLGTWPGLGDRSVVYHPRERSVCRGLVDSQRRRRQGCGFLNSYDERRGNSL